MSTGGWILIGVAFFILMLIIVGLVWGVFNLIKQIESTDVYIEELETKIEKFDGYIVKFAEKIADSYEQLQIIDRIGSFEADDETGPIFKAIKDIGTELNEILNGNREEEEEA